MVLNVHCCCCCCYYWCATGKWGYYALGAYGSLCMAIFMVKTMKRVIFQETRTYGECWCCRWCAELPAATAQQVWLIVAFELIEVLSRGCMC